MIIKLFLQFKDRNVLCRDVCLVYYKILDLQGYVICQYSFADNDLADIAVDNYNAVA